MQPIWTPSAQRIEAANITRFRRHVNSTLSLSLENYGQLHRWSILERESFWEAVWHFTGIISSRSYNSVLTDGDKFPDAKWFQGSQLNFAENLLRYQDDVTALVFVAENGDRQQTSYAELHERVAELQRSLIDVGIQKGDRVAAYLPNIPETVIAMLATTSLGAVWSSCSPDFGVAGVLDRLGQIQPKILFTTNQYQYNGKTIAILERVEKIVASLPSLERVVVVLAAGTMKLPSKLQRAVRYDEFITGGVTHVEAFTAVDFDDPLYIMYSSGTTGSPKCIVHSVGGTLIQHLKEHQLHVGLTRADALFYITTCGWMMWNWLVSGLATGATLVLFDGSPFHPGPRRMFDLIRDESISVFGTSAKFLSAVEKTRVRPVNGHGLDSLHTILSTGSPLPPEGFQFVYEHIKKDLCLSSISGGTDLISCFVLGNPTLPVYAGEIQCAGLGMDVQVFNDAGESVLGEKGELVCTQVFPAVPIGFWNDDDDSKFHAAYFDRFQNVWAHGDFIEATPREGFIIYGRSDSVLNPGGVRIGTAEIYRQVEQIDQVLESLAIGQKWDGDTRIVLFVVLQEEIQLDPALLLEIKTVIRENASPRHVPAKVIQVRDLPRTISGKISELAVSNIVHHRSVDNTDALANPKALEYFRNLAELQ
ncbi:MAG: acetoacetate--CoA ligase [Pseudomonadales bacterium]|jgi:acetoacetyl-CoA synthetase|nr:acetoacetate--CoA ligase [Pseudomonadales bacterium]MDP7359845.1 acetoacetate--CoA ligase [Pseudomonadales bacterium]MDP7595713.1 acetoacetate--CoA ligase [Pseudomonadales bacterium]HJN49173.1 acetoacetate--CoA ligase [Pseudomonadales bacterium]|tara:strand:+ start:6654 stop:8600 length:1947 start_codon:yes stop_codon:yes gene_type:complete